MQEEVTKLALQVATIAITNGAREISDRIEVAKTRKTERETINVLEELISTLISEKNDLIRITQQYESLLQQELISEEDLKFVSVQISSIIKIFNITLTTEQQDLFQSLFDEKTLKLLQTIGFNYNTAIGEPLTNLVATKINSFSKSSPGKNKK